jgi:probable phosphoglycerate mutase
MTGLRQLSVLANRYSAMRHGQSRANAAGLIVSRIETDRGGDYGLTELGRKQVVTAAQAAPLPAETVICSSDFARARETAQIVREQLGAAPVELAEALRERSFGTWDGTTAANYAHVWAADVNPPCPDAGVGGTGVESASAVLDRTAAFVLDLERRYRDRDILLVSHGDTLQILQAGFQRMDPAAHRRLPELGTAEIRRLTLGAPGPAGHG